MKIATTRQGLSKSAQQTIKFFEEFIRKDTVAKFIKDYREILGIPPSGMPFLEIDAAEITKPIESFFYVPVRIVSPSKDNPNPSIRIINTCMAFTGQQGITSMIIASILRYYLIFNKIIDAPLRYSSEHDDLFRIDHLPSELSWYSETDHTLLKHMYAHFHEISKTHPVALFINPEATQNQLKDFISRNWKDIVAYRDTTKTLLNGIRTKKKQQINDRIYELRELSLSQIRKQLADTGVFLDDGHIGKIRQIEKRKRS